MGGGRRKNTVNIVNINVYDFNIGGSSSSSSIMCYICYHQRDELGEPLSSSKSPLGDQNDWGKGRKINEEKK